MPDQEACVLYGRITGLADLLAGDLKHESSGSISEIFDQTESGINMHNGVILDFSGETFSAFFEHNQAHLRFA